MARWGELREVEPDLAEFVAKRLSRPPSYLATVRSDGSPRVHPVTLIFTSSGLYVFMEPTSPKGSDLRERKRFGVHNRIDDDTGTGGEVFVAGRGVPVDDATTWREVARAASYDPAERYVLFELEIDEVRCVGYGDVELPERSRWREPA